MFTVVSLMLSVRVCFFSMLFCGVVFVFAWYRFVPCHVVSCLLILLMFMIVVTINVSWFVVFAMMCGVGDCQIGSRVDVMLYCVSRAVRSHLVMIELCLQCHGKQSLCVPSMLVFVCLACCMCVSGLVVVLLCCCWCVLSGRVCSATCFVGCLVIV